MKKFNSKVDWWILLILMIVTVFLVNQIIASSASYSLNENIQYMILYSFFIFFIWMPVFNTNYTIDKGKLVIKCVFIKWVIDINSINRIEETINPFSAPALSLHRLKIYYIKNDEIKTILISPRHKESFLKSLQI